MNSNNVVPNIRLRVVSPTGLHSSEDKIDRSDCEAWANRNCQAYEEEWEFQLSENFSFFKTTYDMETDAHLETCKMYE